MTTYKMTGVLLIKQPWSTEEREHRGKVVEKVTFEQGKPLIQ